MASLSLQMDRLLVTPESFDEAEVTGRRNGARLLKCCIDVIGAGRGLLLLSQPAPEPCTAKRVRAIKTSSALDQPRRRCRRF